MQDTDPTKSTASQPPESLKPGIKDNQRARVAEFVQNHTGQWIMLRTREGFDMEMLCEDAVTNHLLQHGSFEENLCTLVKNLLIEPATIIDLGANFGFFSCLLGKWQPGSRIVAVEPNPMLVDVVQRNLDRNGVVATLLPVALGVEPGRAHLSFPENRPSRGTLGELPQSPRFSAIREVEIEVITWDRVFEACEGGRVRILKMDIEGYDVKVLAAMSVEQAASVDHIICEFNEKRLAQCGSKRSDLLNASWLELFEVWVVDCAAVPVRLNSLDEFPGDSEILWLRRRDTKN